MQIYYFLYLCPEQTIILAMEIENQSVDYRPLILVAEHYCPVKILYLEINRVDHHPLGR